jgi:hypothetical protein
MSEVPVSTPVVTEQAATQPNAVACMACGHPVASHDRISGRYCDATIAHAATRRCICKV